MSPGGEAGVEVEVDLGGWGSRGAWFVVTFS